MQNIMSRAGGRLVRAALCSAVAAAAVLALSVSAQAQVKINKTSVVPYRFLPSLSALPQATLGQAAGNAEALPHRVPVDPLTFSAMQSQALAPGALMKGAVQVVPRPAAGLAPVKAPKETWNLTVAPEAVFDGISNSSCGAVNGGLIFRPSDMALAVGDTANGVLQGVNDCLSVFDKSGVQQAGFPKATPTFFGVDAIKNPNTSDPRMIFDWINHRYYFVVISYPNSCATQCTTAAFYNLAVSQGDDPTGAWCMYQLNVASGPNPNGGVFFLPDFPRLGQDRQAVYLASNLFQPNFVGEEIIALKKTDLMGACGSTITQTSFTGPTVNSGFFTIQPANIFSPYDDPKSMYFISSAFGTSNQINVAAIHDPFGTPTYTQTSATATNTYSLPPGSTQKGTATLIATGDTRISGTAMYAAGSIYAALTTNVGGSPAEPGIILYEVQPFVDTSGGTNDGKIVSAKILNEIALNGGASTGLFYPVQQPDPEGNVTTVYGLAGTNNFASVAYLSRRAGQTTGTVPDGGIILQNGLNSYVTANPQRWGDYFATAPAGMVSGGGTGGFPKMWFAGQYASNTSGLWNTSIGRTGYNNISQNLPVMTGSR